MTNTQEIDELLSIVTGKTVISPERESAIECIALAAPRGERVEIAREALRKDYTGRIYVGTKTLYLVHPDGGIEVKNQEERA